MKIESRGLRIGVATAIAVACGGVSSAASAGEDFVRAFGPVERVDGLKAISVLGQSFAATSRTIAVVDGRSIANSSDLLSILATNPDASVAVIGHADTQEATRLVVNTHAGYVPGASPIAVAGTVRSVDRSRATFLIGLTEFAFAEILSAHPDFDVKVGDFVQILGTKPGSDALVLVSRAEIFRADVSKRSAESVVQGITGSAVQGITGSAVQGITGSAVQGITGSAVQGITGSAVQGITGSAVQGITGSAIQGITGSAVQGITGSAASQRSLKGITGSAVQGITGSAVQGITVSAASQRSLKGITGSAVQGITGSAVQGITGSAVQGITGSAVQGITGSAVQGIAGSAVQGITGSAVQGITGSAVQGITGSAVQGITGSAASQRSL